MAKLYLKVKTDMCECGARAQYVVAGYKTKTNVLNSKVIGYDCRCKQIPIDIEKIRTTPKVISSY